MTKLWPNPNINIYRHNLDHRKAVSVTYEPKSGQQHVQLTSVLGFVMKTYAGGRNGRWQRMACTKRAPKRLPCVLETQPLLHTRCGFANDFHMTFNSHVQ